MKYLLAVCDLVAQTLHMLLHYLANTRIWLFVNRPVSVVFEPIIRYWRAVPDTPKPDRKHYFASARRRMGIHGRGLYTEHPIVRMEEVHSIEVEELMKDRTLSEPFHVMGTRAELMAQIHGLSNADFDSARTMDYYRVLKLSDFADVTVAAMPNPQTAFRHWLQTQVTNGDITQIDGYVFVQPHPAANPKNCEIGDFLYKYYDSFEAARKLDMHSSYYSVDALARFLLGEILKVSFGVLPVFEFEAINGRIRDRQQSVVRHTAEVIMESSPDLQTTDLVTDDPVENAKYVNRWNDVNKFIKKSTTAES